MAKKRKFKLSKRQRKEFRKLVPYFLVGLLGIIIGIAVVSAPFGNKNPENLVWAADHTVKIPKDLRNYLQSKDDCKEYRGTGSPTGVGLWGVYQVSRNQYAKISYGCSNSLSNYIMAVKMDGKWRLLQPTEYFAPFNDAADKRVGAIPHCAVVEKYKIPSEIESFCIKPDGSAQANELK